MLTNDSLEMLVRSPAGAGPVTSAHLFAPRWLVRVRARARGRALDRALSCGADPASTPQLAARAATLTNPPMRNEVADVLERLIRTEGEPRSRLRVLPFRNAIRVNADELHALSALLRGSTPVYARGVAMLRTLLIDGTGPAYTDRDGDAFALRLDSVRAAISGIAPVT
jgi:hypothetical protein